MTGVQFADGFDGPDRIALGLSAPQLATVVAGGLGGYGLLHSPLPGAVRVPAAALLAMVAAALGWGRIAERPLLDWCWLTIRFASSPRSGGTVLAAGDSDDAEPPWARWLRQGGARRDGEGAPVGAETAEPEAEDPGGQPAWTVEDALPAAAETGALPPPADDLPVGGTPVGNGARVPDDAPADARRAGLAATLRARWGRRRGGEDAGRGPAVDDGGTPRETAPAPRAPSSRIVDIDRPSIVLLPEPLTPHRPDPERPTDADDDDPLDEDDDLADLDQAADGGGLEDGSEQVAELRGAPLLRLPGVRAAAPAPEPATTTVDSPPARRVTDAPVFVGATRRITFFSLNGGSGRTTLATEVACLLAARGAHRPSADADAQPLRVALLDLDLRSANVAMRLGVPQPTILDYLLEGGEDPAAVERFLVQHPSGLQVLLGPPKPLGQSGPGLEPATVAEIVHQLERGGAHFIVIDVGADLGAVTTWVLTAVHDIYVVIRPTASGIQDAYRSTEALRRLGLGHKLRYVVNRVRGQLDVDEVMADLGGRIAATIPDDPRVEDAENRHRQVCLTGQGPAAVAIARLAAGLYPGLDAPARRGRFGRLRKRRVG